jgi:rhamnosyl/mannosyltransferase
VAPDRTTTYRKPIGDDSSVAPEISVIVPTFNEAANVRELLRCLAEALASRPLAEIIFVDDSTDDTATVIELAAVDCPVPVVLVRRGRPLGGLGGAVVDGLKLARAPWAVVMDGDLQHPPSLVPVLHDHGREAEADLVVATRYAEGGSREGLGSVYRRTVSSSLTALAGTVLGAPVSQIADPLSGFFAVRIGALRLDEARPLGYKVLLDLIVRFDLRSVVQVPYEFGHRYAGESKSGMKEGVRYLRHLAQLWDVQRRRRWSEQLLLGSGSGSGPDPSGSRLSVLVVTSEAPPVVSGISRCVDRVAAGMRERGHHVDVISSAQIPRFMVGEYRFSTLLFLWPLLVRRFRHYDVINLHGPVPTLSDVFLILRRLFTSAATPVVYTHHSALEIRGVERLCAIYNRLHRWLSRSATLTVATSDYYASDQRMVGGPPVRIVPWGVDMRPEPLRPELPGRPLRVLFVGQMRSYKGIEWLLPAVAGRPELELRLIGSGSELGDYRRVAERLGGDNVQFLGRVTDEELHAAYDRSDVVVLPSVTQAEAFGLVVLEGMAAGCVPVVSDLPGVRDLVGNVGMVVPARDADTLAAALVGLAADPERLTALGLAARTRAKELSWDTCVSRYEEAFRTVAHPTPVEPAITAPIPELRRPCRVLRRGRGSVSRSAARRANSAA